MIGLSKNLIVYAYAKPVDMRKAFDALSAIVTYELKRDLLAGDVFLFVGRNRRRAKALYFDGTGLCLLAKRLEKGRFSAPWQMNGTSAVKLTMNELALFFEGSELVGRVRLSPTPLMLG
jgi:transposase